MEFLKYSLLVVAVLGVATAAALGFMTWIGFLFTVVTGNRTWRELRHSALASVLALAIGLAARVIALYAFGI